MRLGEADVRALLARVVEASPADETQVTLTATTSALTRFANNTIHQNTAEDDLAITVKAVVGRERQRRMARVQVNTLDEARLCQAAEDAVRLARLSPKDPALPAMPRPQTYRALAANRFDPETATCSPQARAVGVRRAIAIAEAGRCNAAGCYATEKTVVAIANSAGLFAYSAVTGADFSMTAQRDGSSGWAKAVAPRVVELDIEALAHQAVEKARQGAKPTELKPGRYTVILEPAAVVDLLAFITSDFGGQAVQEKRSCFTGRLGKRLLGENMSLEDDVYHPLQIGLPFDSDGLPRQTVLLIEQGVVKRLVYSLATAKKMRTKPTGHGLPYTGDAAEHLVLAGGSATVDHLIASTDRGLLITRFWYIREVDTMKKILTGMTRDGTFWIEGGKVRHGVKNLRFNQSLIDLFKNVEAWGRPVRAGGEEFESAMVVPPLKARGFLFTASTSF